MEILLRQIPNDYKFKKKYLDTHAKEIKTLILGNSQSFYGIDPVYFSSNTFNASYISQSLDYDLEILKMYWNSLENLESVVLSISYFTLFDNLEAGSESWRVKNYVIYCGINSSNSLRDYTEILSNRFSVNLKRLGSHYIKGNSNITCTELGWGVNYKSENSRDLIKTGKTAGLRHTRKNFQFLNDNIITLKTFIELCESHKVKVVLFTPPAFITYRQNLNAEQLKRTIASANEISREYNNCLYINLLENTEFSAKDFYDADHLNEIGAKKLSSMINRLINDKNERIYEQKRLNVKDIIGK